AWLRGQWDGPLMIKGVLHPEDARRAVDVGAEAVVVSNHGGNDMDGAIPSIAALPAVVDAVGAEIEVLLDSGIRRGSDVVKALAMGARAVMIGRAHLWALAAGGETGVAQILEVFRRGIAQSLTAIGVSGVDALGPQHVIVPEHFYDAQDPAAAGNRTPPTDAS
ncbi:MAG: alpha-hydroxy-acid oxidizing protein, partial [Actinomycetota bacterium]|nr:alpha-hydroxy-acid oxidizing protein [Actinomycetota bacterium]